MKGGQALTSIAKTNVSFTDQSVRMTGVTVTTIQIKGLPPLRVMQNLDGKNTNENQCIENIVDLTKILSKSFF